ncbi:hypothetical protein LG314_00570 [Agrococcus terreus]|uniref:hypothetical protein n=1 Tax=Agrococcus terreus TaxID=574649 RepID=UPI00384D63B3
MQERRTTGGSTFWLIAFVVMIALLVTGPSAGWLLPPWLLALGVLGTGYACFSVSRDGSNNSNRPD